MDGQQSGYSGVNMSNLATFLVTCSLGACAMAWFLMHPADADDVQSVWDLFFLVVAVSICASAGALTQRRFLLAFVVLFGFALGSMIILELLSTFAKARIWNLLSLILGFAAIAGAISFSVAPRRPVSLVVGALSGVTGLSLVGMVSWVAWQIWPARLTELEPANFVTLIAFGPVMGLSLGVPFELLQLNSPKES